MTQNVLERSTRRMDHQHAPAPALTSARLKEVAFELQAGGVPPVAASALTTACEALLRAAKILEHDARR